MALNLGRLILLSLFMAMFSSCESSRNPASKSIAETKFLGTDVSDNKRECVDKFETLECSQEFTESDQFALECERSGQFAIQCNCHDWICVEKISSAKKLSY